MSGQLTPKEKEFIKWRAHSHEQKTKEFERLINAGHRKVRVELPFGEIQIIRIFKSGGQICQFHKGSSRRGYPISLNEIQKISPIITRKTPEKKWEDAWKKIKARLEKSGLWEDIIQEIDLALDIGYQTLRNANQDYWKMSYNVVMKTRDYKDFAQKYPKLVGKNSQDKTHALTSIIWRMSQMPVVKKMRFSKWENDKFLQTIQHAMDRKKACHVSGRYVYDISFEYNPDKKKAYYSEEYKGCGNGHYYLALDSTHALYLEKD